MLYPNKSSCLETVSKLGSGSGPGSGGGGVGKEFTISAAIDPKTDTLLHFLSKHKVSSKRVTGFWLSQTE